MTVVIDKGSSFLHVPLVTVRDLLHACHKHGIIPEKLSRAKGMHGTDPKTIAVLLSELSGLGLIGEQELTEEGESLAFATARPRTARDKAQSVLDEFLRSCALVNARKSLPFKVKEVWLFGSMLDSNRDKVGDVDIAMEIEWPLGRGPETDEIFEKLALKLGANSLLETGGLLRDRNIRRFVIDRVLHGARRNPLLSIEEDVGVLSSLGCPCMKVFDREAGGRVKKPEPIERHPSKDRAYGLNPRRKMPDLSLTGRPISPVSTKMVSQSGWDWRQDKDRFRRLAGLPRPERDRRVSFVHFGEDVETRSNRWRSEIDGETALRLFGGRQDFDGVHGSGVVINVVNDQGEMIPAIGAVLERTIEARDDVVEVIYDIVEAKPSGAAPAVMAEGVAAASWWAQDLASVDIEAILRRDMHEDMDRSIQITIRGGGTAGHLVSRYLQRSMEAVISNVHDKVGLLRHPETTVIADQEASLGLRL